MCDDIYLRTVKYGEYIVDNNSTIRQTAKAFNVAKSTVHYDLKNRLRNYDEDLYLKVKRILDINFSEKHIRGGWATKQKYKHEREAINHNRFGTWI